MGAAGLPCSHPGTSTQPWAGLPPCRCCACSTQPLFGDRAEPHRAAGYSCTWHCMCPAHPGAKLIPGKAPQDTLAQPCCSHLIRRMPHLLQVFLQHLLRGFTCGKVRVKEWEKPTARGAEGMGGTGEPGREEGPSLLPFLACFLVVLRQEWEMPGMDWISLLLTGGGCSTSLGGRVRHTGSPAALMRIPVIPAKGGNKWH